MFSKVKKFRLSYGTKVKDTDEDDMEKSVTTHKRRITGNINTPFIQSIIHQTASSPGHMAVNFIQQRSIKAFRGLPNEDAARFLEEYEKMGSYWNS